MREINLLLLIVLLLAISPVHAYIGPGSGLPFIGSFIGFIVSVVLVISAILFWPIRKILKKKKAKKQNLEP